MNDQGHGVLFVGVGAMGAPMAARLATVTESLHVSDIDDSHAAEVAARIGCQAVSFEDLGDAAANSGTVILMLPDSSAVQGVLVKGPALLERMSPGSVVVDMGSSDPRSTVELAGIAREREIGYVDAPVSGGVPKATTGELAVMVGGIESDIEGVTVLLEAMGKDVTHIGPHGSGHAMKALNNLLSAIHMVGAAEVVAIGEQFGIPAHVAIEVINNSTGRTQATELKFPRYILPHIFDSGFAMRLMVKDIRTAVGLVGEAQTATPISVACVTEWSDALASLGNAADHTQIAEYVEMRTGVVLR